jgi:hypothetical protein
VPGSATEVALCGPRGSRGISSSENDVRYPGSATEAACGVQKSYWAQRASGADAQPVVSPDEKAIGCNITCRDDCGEYKFSINQCESHVKSDLDTISLNVDTRDTKKLKFLIDTGAEISIIRSLSLTPGVNYQLHEGVDIKGIYNTVMRTEGIIDLKLLMDTHETVHTFHVLGEPFELTTIVFW